MDRIELKEQEKLQSYVDRVCSMVYTMNPIEHRKAIIDLAEQCYNRGIEDAKKNLRKEGRNGNN